MNAATNFEPDILPLPLPKLKEYPASFNHSHFIVQQQGEYPCPKK